jgi:eukaryotic-like serine/threonine-protein kinase
MDHSTQSLLRIEAIFNEALAAAAAERSSLITKLCDQDAALMAEVYSLLKACEAEERVTASNRAEPKTTFELPERKCIGPYQIDRLLGRGGMGAVYLAHRVDGQFEQQVAIKLIDLPLATDFFRERFRQERQILAGLQHPLIARLLDGGVTPEGDLYLAMEYVDGMPIHRFCEGNRLPGRKRLALFKRVCEAVQFAHQNLVVHRDLKPDNILVDKDGTPHLLDFGTAKLLSTPSSTQRPELTRQGYHSFTPQYASPEQVLGNPITTASDTYSLGVLLYLLLTGNYPYELKEFTTAEMVRVICQEPPRKPSYSEDPGRRLDADVDAIVLKALRKEPQERYLTAEQLASDVQAYLDGQPVSARQGTFRYRAGKFVRRNRLALAAVAMLAVTLFAGLAGVLWQARVANAERRKAESRSEDLRQLSNSLLSELAEAMKQIPGSTGAQQLLVTRVLEHLDRMAKDAYGDRTSELDLIDAYTRLGNIQGNAYDQNLGDREGGLAILDKAIALAKPLVASAPEDRPALRALAMAQESKGELLSESGDIQGSVASLQSAVQIYDRLIALPGIQPVVFTEAATANNALGDVSGQDIGLADIASALASYRKALDLNSRAAALDPKFMSARRGLATMQMKIGNAELDIDPAQALKDFQLALQRFDALPDSEKTKLSTMRLRTLTQRKVAVAFSELGEYEQGIPLFVEAIKTHQKLADVDSKDIRNLIDLKHAVQGEAMSYVYAANPVLSASGGNRRQNLLNAEYAFQRQQAAAEQLLKLTPKDTGLEAELAELQVHIAAIQHMLKEPGDSAQRSRAALAELRNAASKGSASTMVLDLVVTAFFEAEPESLRDPEFALACAERGVALTHRKMPEWLLMLAQAYRATGQTEKASAAAEEGLALLPNWPPGSPKPRIRKLLELEAKPRV